MYKIFQFIHKLWFYRKKNSDAAFETIRQLNVCQFKRYWYVKIDQAKNLGNL